LVPGKDVESSPKAVEGIVGVDRERILRGLVAGLMLAVFSWAPAHGQSKVEAQLVGGGELARDAGGEIVLRVGTSGDYPPFSEAVEAGGGDLDRIAASYRGFDIQIAEAFAKDAGFRIEWIRFSWPELVSDLREGRFDIAMSGVTVRPERSAVGRFSVPIVDTGAMLLYRPSAKLAGVESMRLPDALARFDRPEIRIAVNLGGHLERVARAQLSKASIEAIGDNAEVGRALAEGRVDAVVTDTLEAPKWAIGMESVATVGPITRDRKAYWVSSELPELSERLDAWLMAREADGTLDSLRRRELGIASGQATAAPLPALLAAIDERLALMPWVAETKRRSGQPVEDPAREARVMAAARLGISKQSARLGAPIPEPLAVDAFYRAQISAAKLIQARVLSEPSQFDASASDLPHILRPALIRIGDRMAQLVVALGREEGPPPANLHALVARELSGRALTASDVQTLAESLSRLIGDADDSGEP